MRYRKGPMRWRKWRNASRIAARP